jgi:hypothetical protein
MVSNLLKRWRVDFAIVKRQRDGFSAFGKETGCHPASSCPTSSTDYIYYVCVQLTTSAMNKFNTKIYEIYHVLGQGTQFSSLPQAQKILLSALLICIVEIPSLSPSSGTDHPDSSFSFLFF